MDTVTLEHAPRYTASCRYCARIVFRSARHLGEVQLIMIESHLLVCRPLARIESPADLFDHCRVSESAS